MVLFSGPITAAGINPAFLKAMGDVQMLRRLRDSSGNAIIREEAHLQQVQQKMQAMNSKQGPGEASYSGHLRENSPGRQGQVPPVVLQKPPAAMEVPPPTLLAKYKVLGMQPVYGLDDRIQSYRYLTQPNARKSLAPTKTLATGTVARAPRDGGGGKRFRGRSWRPGRILP
ncbi:hypothetical protein RvY_00844 [Ramazzottius varieornatus]|uniref:Uncharacterized protein n=1 Tax=Ramazzottius varieornatus TaxID=947166 RepID=A0A1D1UNZ6_RAMVA|nr:hypothetical protein RvY_00844 [Ramazzottius varieornatus]